MTTGTDASIDMHGPDVRVSSIHALMSDPQWPTIAREYEDECGVDEMVSGKVNWDMYRAIEAGGNLTTVTAFDGDTLVGFCVLVMLMHPKYSNLVATTESIFVRREYRTTGIGLRLFRFVERMARDMGAVAMLCSTGVDGNMSQLMPALKYRHTNQVFFKRLA